MLPMSKVNASICKAATLRSPPPAVASARRVPAGVPAGATCRTGSRYQTGLTPSSNRTSYGRKEPENPVVALLTGLEMLQFARPLFASGFDDLETLMDMSSEDMAEIGMKRGHMIKLRKRLQELGAPAQPEQPQKPEKPAPQAAESLRSSSSQAHAQVAAAPASAIDVCQLGELGGHPTGRQLTAVQLSWERVKVLGEEHVGGVMCMHLFEQSPEMKAFFPLEVRTKYQTWALDEGSTSLELHQSPAMKALFGRKISALGYFIAGMSKTTGILPRVKQLGMRHVGYGNSQLVEVHWEKLERALMAALRTVLGETFTPEVEVAWAMVFQFMSAIMLCGHKEAMQIAEKARQAVQAKQEGLPQQQAALRTPSNITTATRTSSEEDEEEPDSPAPSSNQS